MLRSFGTWGPRTGRSPGAPRKGGTPRSLPCPVCGHRENPAGNRQKKGENASWSSLPPGRPKHTFPATRGLRAARPELRLPLK